ncbi:MAG TPA: NAD(P)-dependent oxidoreductase [Mycobacteriales bacterium]|nr:NAD(P)-dependent oxidoreductase [Mycobacteriales bacterium]
MAVVVTGAAGFIGRQLVAALRGRGQDVVAVDRRPCSPAAGVRSIEADLVADLPAVRAALWTADAVFHLAGCPGVRDAAADIAQRRRRDNVVAAAVVLAATPPSTPVVVTSSSSVYGGAAAGGCRESDRLRPRGGYARTKVAVERLCAARLRSGGHVAIARPFTVAGEGQRADMALAIWLESAALGRPITILGSPARTRDVTDVRDVVRGLIAMADRRVTGPVNLGTGTGHRLDALTAAVLAVTGAPVDLVVAAAGRDEVADTLADTTRTGELLGFVPHTDLIALVRRQAAAAGIGGDRAVPAAECVAAAR